jgi:hypothetical protein
MSAHTPGPWKIIPSKTVLKYELKRANTSVAWHAPEHEANAKLIAAAPKLLEALQVARDVIVNGGEIPEDMALIDAAIAEATS